MTVRMKPLATLKQYFGFRPGEGIKDFADEVKKLTDDERLELARSAAVELGTELDEG